MRAPSAEKAPVGLASAITTAPSIRNTRQLLRRTACPHRVRRDHADWADRKRCRHCSALAQWTNIDLWLADLYYDPVRRVFPWDNTWFARDFMHGYLKNVIVWFGFLAIAATLIDLVYPLFRKIALAPPAVALRRHRFHTRTAARAHPEGVVQSALPGGHRSLRWPRAPLLRLFDAVPLDWHAGHCFPAGHASAGMWLSALAVFWLPANPRKALAVFLGGLFVGLTMGWVQQMRGMHFLTHTLATAWLSTALLFAMLVLFWNP